MYSYSVHVRGSVAHLCTHGYGTQSGDGETSQLVVERPRGLAGTGCEQDQGSRREIRA